MASYRVAEEVEQEHLRAFGPTLGPLYHALEDEVTWLHAKWLESQKLFAKSERRVDVLNDTAGFFFMVVQDVFRENILLHIARLTDPPTHGRFEHLTMLRLPGAICDSALASEIQTLVDAAEDRSEFAREWRNKRIAHRDLALALDPKAEPLPGVNTRSVEQALASFAAVINTLRARYLGGKVAFTPFLAHGDADALVHWLRIALRSEELRGERLRTSRSLPEDLEVLPEA